MVEMGMMMTMMMMTTQLLICPPPLIRTPSDRTTTTMSIIPPLLSQQEAFTTLHARLPPSASGFLAYYSTVLGGITNDPAAFVVPLDDHMVHRGHAGELEC